MIKVVPKIDVGVIKDIEYNPFPKHVHFIVLGADG